MAGLKAVRWSRLEHAYGSASDVPGAPDEAVTSVLDGLSRASGTDAFAPATAALRLTFGAQGSATRAPYDALTEPQRRTVRVLADLGEETWQWLNFIEIVRAWNLPEEREECRRYAGLPDA